MLNKPRPKPMTPEEFIRAKTHWHGHGNDVWCFYCPQCRTSRKLPYRSRPGGVRQIGRVILAALFFTLVCWPIFGLKGIVAVVPFWAIFETVYRLKLRAELECPHCGFDPYLYLTDIPKARARMEEHWQRVFSEKGLEYKKAKLDGPQA